MIPVIVSAILRVHFDYQDIILKHTDYGPDDNYLYAYYKCELKLNKITKRVSVGQ